jgi:hypothetical protein
MSPTERAEHMQSGERRYKRATVVAGVDTLGRVLVAVDADHDGYADECLLFTDSRRLEGPWSIHLEEADVVSTLGTLKIEASDRSFAMALAVEGAALPRLKAQGRRFGRIFIEDEGFEQARMIPPEGQYGGLLSSMIHTDVQSWPASFWYDALDPGSCQNCNSAECDAGGCGATSCDIGPPQCFVTNCSVTCGSTIGDRFACCECTIMQPPPPACRCITCVTNDQ